MLLVVGVHLLASYVGQRMDRKRIEQDRESFQTRPPGEVRSVVVPGKKNPNLAERTRLPVWQVCSTAQATVIGGGLGVLSSRWLPPQECNWAVLTVCVISGAALGGIWCFVIGNLTEHVIRSLISAHQGEVA